MEQLFTEIIFPAINTKIFNESGETDKVLSILNDRAQGGSCLTLVWINKESKPFYSKRLSWLFFWSIE